jgi:hypothetical protein
MSMQKVHQFTAKSKGNFYLLKKCKNAPGKSPLKPHFNLPPPGKLTYKPQKRPKNLFETNSAAGNRTCHKFSLKNTPKNDLNSLKMVKSPNTQNYHV